MIKGRVRCHISKNLEENGRIIVFSNGKNYLLFSQTLNLELVLVIEFILVIECIQEQRG
jgi:hypothetical protein